MSIRARGDGWVEWLHDGALEAEIWIHNGDDTIVARPLLQQPASPLDWGSRKHRRLVWSEMFKLEHTLAEHTEVRP
jgi:hypothetical protein